MYAHQWRGSAGLTISDRRLAVMGIGHSLRSEVQSGVDAKRGQGEDIPVHGHQAQAEVEADLPAAARLAVESPTQCRIHEAAAAAVVVPLRLPEEHTMDAWPDHERIVFI